MTKAQQKRIVKDLLKNTMKDIIKNKIPYFPENWDTVEIRNFIADSFGLVRCEMVGQRLTDYKNTLLNENL